MPRRPYSVDDFPADMRELIEREHQHERKHAPRGVQVPQGDLLSCGAAIARSGAPEGFRDRAAYMLAQQCVRVGLTQSRSEEIVRGMVAASPGKDKPDASSKVRSAMRAGKHPIGCELWRELGYVCPDDCPLMGKLAGIPARRERTVRLRVSGSNKPVGAPESEPDGAEASQPAPRAKRAPANSPGAKDGQAEEKTYYELTDMGNARRLVEQHGEDLRWCEDLKTWYIWDGVRWRPDNLRRIELCAQDTIGSILEEAGEQRGDLSTRTAKWFIQSQNAQRIGGMISLARSLPGVPIEATDLDQDPWLFACANGTVDLRYGTLRDSLRGDLITQRSPVHWKKGAKAPLWERFLEEILPDPDIRAYVRRVFGYTLTGFATEHVLLFLYGTGANGKSVLLNVFRHIAGEYGVQCRPELFMEKRGGGSTSEDAAQLRGKRLAVTVEVEDGSHMVESMVKQMTGGDELVARPLFSNPIHFQQTHQIWVATNHRPVVRGQDHAIWRRIFVVPFTVTIEPDRQDKDLYSKLIAEDSGILNWALDGCCEWQRFKGLAPPDAVQAATAEYRTSQDTVGQWLAECCEMHVDFRESSRNLYDSYGKWTISNGGKPKSQQSFGRTLTERGYEVYTAVGLRRWKGIRVRTEEDVDE